MTNKSKNGLIQLHQDPNINFQLNRGYLWGNADLNDLKIAAGKIETLDDWNKIFWDLAENTRTINDNDKAMTYYRMAEFFMSPTNPQKKKAYNFYMRYFELQHKNDKTLIQVNIPYKDKFMPAMILHVPKTVPLKNRIIITLGFDGFMEEIYPTADIFRKKGYEIIIFEGPGQGRSLHEQKIPMTYEWEEPVKAVIDFFNLDNIILMGISLGGYLALRAAAFEKRISAVIAYNVIWDFYDVISSRKGEKFKWVLNILTGLSMKHMLNNIIKNKMKKDNFIRWGIEQGIMVMGSNSPYEFLKTLKYFSMKKISGNITQDILLTAGEKDHFVPLSFFYKQMKAITNAHSLTGRIFTKQEGGESHCQLGNIDLPINYFSSWIDGLENSVAYSIQK